MDSYVGPAQLLVAGHTRDVEVNLHEFVDLTAAPQARWRGVVVNASFTPIDAVEVAEARLRIPGRGEAPVAVRERRLAGDGTAPFRGDGPGALAG